MAKPWSEISASPGFRGLPPEKQEEVRISYFNSFVAPRVKPDQLESTRRQFDAQTRGSVSQQGAVVADAGSGEAGTARALPIGQMPTPPAQSEPNALERGVKRAAETIVTPIKNIAKLASGQDPYAPGETTDLLSTATSKRAGGALLDVAAVPMTLAAGGVKGGLKALLEGAAAAGVVGAAGIPEWAAEKNRQLEGWLEQDPNAMGPKTQGILDLIAKATGYTPIGAAMGPEARKAAIAAGLGTALEALPDVAATGAVARSLSAREAARAKAQSPEAIKAGLESLLSQLEEAPNADQVSQALKEATGRHDLQKPTFKVEKPEVREMGVRPDSFNDRGIPMVTEAGAVVPRETLADQRLQGLNELLDQAAAEPTELPPPAAEAADLMAGRLPGEPGYGQVPEPAPQAAPEPPRPVLEAPVAETVAPEPVPKAPEPAAPGTAQVATPQGNRYPVRYKVVEADSLVTSHDPLSFAENPRYPKGVQERDYLRDTNEQAKVIGNAKPGKFAAQRVLSDIDTAEAGPPIVTPDNIVMGGNSRGMTMRRVYDGPEAQAFRQQVLDRAKAMGIEGAEGMQRPVLVREMSLPSSDPVALSRLSRELNAEFTGGKGAVAETVSAGRSLSPESRQTISDVLSDYDTMGDALKSKENTARVIDALTKDGIVNPSKLSEFAENGVMTDRGVARLRDTLVGALIDDKAVLTALPESIKQNIAKNVQSVAAIQAAPGEWNVSPMIKEGAKLAADARRTGMTVDEFVRQGDLLGADMADPVSALMMAKLFSGKPTKLKTALRNYTTEIPVEGGLNLMSKDFKQAFKDAFGIEPPSKGAPLVDEVQKTIERFKGQEGSVNPEVIVEAVANAADKVASVGRAAFADAKPATLEFLPEGYTPGGAAAMGQLAGKPGLDWIPGIARTLNAVSPELFHFVNAAERVKVGFSQQRAGQWEAILQAAGADSGTFKGATPEMLAMKKAVRMIPENVKTRLRNDEAFVLALNGSIPVEALPPRMKQAIPAARKWFEVMARSQGVPDNMLLDPEKYVTHVIDVPEKLRQIHADKELLSSADMDYDGWAVSNPYLKERVGVQGWSLDPRKIGRAYVRQASRKIFDEPVLERLTEYQKQLKSAPPDADRQAKIDRIDYLRDTYLGKQNAAWNWADKRMQNVTPKALESLFAKMDQTQAAQWLRDQGFGYLSDSLPKRGWTKATQRSVAQSMYIAVLGQAWNTAFWNLVGGGNTAAMTGFKPAAAGYGGYGRDYFMKKLDPSYKGKIDKTSPYKAVESIVDGASQLANSNTFMGAVERIAMKPMELTERINRGAAFLAGLARGQKLVDAGVLPANDPAALVQYANGIESASQFEYGPLNSAPIFDAPIVGLFRVLGTYPQNQAVFARDLLKNPADKKILGVPTGFWRLALFSGMVFGAGKMAGLNVGEKVGIKEDREGNVSPLSFIPGVGQFAEIPGLSVPAGWAGIGRGDVLGGGPAARGLGGLVNIGQPGYEGEKGALETRKWLEMLAAGRVGVPLRAVTQLGDLASEASSGIVKEPRKSLIRMPWEDPQVRKPIYRVDPLQAVERYLGAKPAPQQRYEELKRKKRQKKKRD